VASKIRYLTLAEIGRKLDIPYGRLYQLVQRGRLVPDAKSGALYLFNETSVSRVQRLLTRLFPDRFAGLAEPKSARDKMRQSLAARRGILPGLMGPGSVNAGERSGARHFGVS
jgi:hypothetical protein